MDFECMYICIYIYIYMYIYIYIFIEVRGHVGAQGFLTHTA